VNSPDVATLLEIGRRDGRPVCFDTSAMLAYLSDEPGAPFVARLLNDVSLTILISTVTLAEIAVRPARLGQEAVMAIVGRVLGLPRLAVQPLDEATALKTAEVRAPSGLLFPDAAVVATARMRGSVALIGNDRGWRNKSLGIPVFLLNDLTP